MKRTITGFRLDEHGDWTAVLDCGHPQHVRHKPPFVNRPWVTTAAGREGKLGAVLNCVRCDRFELPADAVLSEQTPDYTEATVPGPLLREHVTGTGVWGEIVVREGNLHYHVGEPETSRLLTPDQPGVIIPEAPHRLELTGPVRFHIRFYRLPGSGEQEPV